MEGNPMNHPTIFEAAQNGDLQEVQRHLDQGTSPDEMDTRLRWPLLHFAAAGGHPEVLALLLTKGADIHQPSQLTGTTALHTAAYHGQLAAARFLLENGARGDATSTGGDSPLHAAVLSNSS